MLAGMLATDRRRRLGRAITVALLGVAVLLLPAAGTAVAQTGGTGTLSVRIDGWGSGTVTSSPSGIDCHLVTVGDPYGEGFDQTLSGSCHAQFPVGTVVTVTAAPDVGSVLNGSDCGGQTGNPCRRTVTSGYNAAWVMVCPHDGLCSAG